jgi:hypothetical protein
MLLNVWRYVVVTVNGELPPVAEMASGEIVVRPAKSGVVWEDGTSFLIAACIPHRDALPSHGEQIVVPAEVYKPLHTAIEHYVNMLAVQMRSKRWLASPALYAAIEPADEAAREWLGSYKISNARFPKDRSESGPVLNRAGTYRCCWIDSTDWPSLRKHCATCIRPGDFTS